MRIALLLGLSLALATSPAITELQSFHGTASSPAGSEDNEQPIVQQQQQTPIEINPSGRTPLTSVGQVGRRQSRDDAAEQANIKPMARITNRIQNRVQNRIRNRIDRNYDPQANVNTPFVVADEQVRKGGRPR
ncbi:hypothetical protein [Sphingomonas melonis]|uniref:hypothetical protein n=1 Tax=Sphingomonas melonis TaxID=152682 RepID=UPI0012DFD6D2|nr:hypothetical protein [Sphingomonas melonis]